MNAGHNITNTGGVINIANGSVLNQFGSSITGGTINTTGTGAVVAHSSTANILSGVTLNGLLDAATIANSRQRISNGITLNGNVNIANGGIVSLDSTLAPANGIGGAGTFNLNDAGARIALDGTGTSTLGANIVVRGQGNIGGPMFSGGTNNLTNNGRISSDVSGGTLSIIPGGGSGSVTNNGLFDARGGGTLKLSANINNTGGLIDAQNGSVVLQNGITITGGTIGSTGTGVFRADSSPSSNFLSNVAISGVLDLTTVASSRERIVNGATINGAINIANGGILGLDSANTSGGNQTIGGTAVINLNDAAAHLSINGNGATTLDSGITVRGQGSIGSAAFVGGNNTLTNKGLISADVNGGTLGIDRPAGNGTFINNGTLQAINGATLLLSTNVTANAGSQIIAGAGSKVVQSGVTINGVINASGAGVFTAVSSAANFLDGVNFTGTLDLSSIVNSRERIGNGATINGAINVANGGILGLDSSLTAGGNQTLSGTAIINLNDPAAHLSIDGNGSTTLGAGITVRGQGNIGTAGFAGGNNTLTNNGLISADVNGGTLIITPPANGGSVINNNTLQAINGATLLLSTSINNAGQIIAGAGSTVVQNGVTLNGVINAAGTGALKVVSSGANFLNGVNFTGTLDLSSIVNSRERIGNGATINGAINVANGGILGLDSSLTAGGNQTLSGTAIINLNDPAAHLSIDGNGSTTLGAGITVRGQGNIGTAGFAGGINTLTNNGLISADVNGGTLIITPPANGGSFINNNTLQAINGATLLLSTSINNAGQIIAGAGSTVVQNGVTLNGVINAAGTGALKVVSSFANFLDGVSFTGNLDLSSIANSREQIINGATINGVVNVANGGVLGLNSASTTTPTAGNQTISGTGVINLNDAAARLSIDGNGSTTLASGITVRGQGNIGTASFAGGTNTLFNNGTILADGGTLAIANPANGGSLAGTGTLQTSGGTLNLVGLTSAITQGKLVMGGAGSALTLGTQNLTITNDYTNAQSGSGNFFVARAGVSGAGKILAGGNAAQAITGSNVTNGSTANATLTIGNVRVGATTFDYQVANTGITGPSLRGAIQTNVNGANLNDARLTGAGVTASNYNTGGPGSNTGNLGVTFTAAGAGALAPLSGQVLNLRSNFENIADQKLNIVLAGGAAAYNAAIGSASSPVQVANQRTGGSNTATLTVANSAAAGAFSEDLNASVGGSSGAATGSGSIAGRLAGSNSGGGAITVGVNTASAGAKTGTVTLNYQTAGAVNGVSNGLGVASVGNEAITVNGNVYLIAQPNPSALPANVNLGNFRAGSGAQSQNINIANTNVAPAGFQEGLAAVVQGTSGTATGTGFANAAAGASGALQVGLSGIAAGINSGSVQVQLQSNGITTSGSNGLGSLNLGGSQTVNVAGTGWRLAQANAQPASINFGNVLVGSSQAQFLNIQNTATADGFSERLDASFKAGGTTGDATNNGGSVVLLAAGASNNAAMSVGVNTASSGAKTGQVVVAFNSNGSGTSGLGITGLPDQGIGILANVTANVGNLASAGLTPTTVNFGKFREGAPNQTQQLTVSNLTVGQGEGLNASFGASSGGAGNNAGSITSLATASSNNTSMSVSLGGLATAGAKSGTQVLNFVSDGSFNNNVPTNLPSQSVDLSAEVYRLASAGVTTPINLAARRVGDVAATGVLTLSNTAANDGFSEGLRGTFGAAPAGFAVSGAASTALIAAGAAEPRNVSLSTAVAGNFGGNLNIALVSNGAGTSGFGDAPLADKNVALSGKVYTAAVGQLAAPTVDFGIVRVGDVVGARNVTVQNSAAATALNDTLRADLSGLSGPISGNGSVSGIGAQASGNIAVGLSTVSAGIFSRTGTVGFLSQNLDMADILAGANGNVEVKAQVNNLANADFDLLSGIGTLTQSGSDYVLDLGNIVLGSSIADLLQLDNDVLGPADFLNGSFDLTAATDFLFAGWNGFNGLGAGNAVGGLEINFTAAGLGIVEDTIVFNGFGYNASDPNGLAQSRNLLIRAKVIDQGGTVPEPGTLLLVMLGLLGVARYGTRRTGIACWR